MRDLLSQILAEGEPALNKLVSQRTVETVTLYFKEKSNPDKPEFDRDDKTNFGTTLSGFANSAGGLVIWGVEARKNADKIDCAVALKPITGIERFRSDAQTLCGQLLMPRHDGSELFVVPSDDQSGRGYLIVKVDKSERRPHRSEASGHRVYYKRAGDSFFEMEHYDIEDAFRRAGSPQLEVDLRVVDTQCRDERDVRTLSVQFALLLTNTSTSICRFPYLQVLAEKNLAFSGPFGLAPSPSLDGWQSFFGGANDVIHPEQQLLVLSVRVHHQEDAFLQTTFSMGLKIRYGGAGLRRTDKVVKKSPTDMQDIFRLHNAMI